MICAQPCSDQAGSGQDVTFIEPEIASQPACWRQAADQAGAADLPTPGEWVAVVGCGTSLYIAQSYAARREAAGHGETDAFPASEMPDRPYDAVVALSRSGTTTEVLDVVRHLNGPRVVVVTADPASPLAAAADRLVPLAYAREDSVVQTRFATTALALFRASLGDDLDAAIADAEAALTLAPPADPRAHLVFLGTGWTVGLANEAALKCRESAGAWTESYPAPEYRHGPISAAGAASLVWSLDSLPAGLGDEIRATGAQVVDSSLDPMAELVRIQRYAVGLARAAGRDPDRPRNLSYSVILQRSE
jgi:fructoselysine-6-P-deglycase FrlB-like protein